MPPRSGTRRRRSVAGVGSLINLFNPERIVLGGWAGVALGAATLPIARLLAAGGVRG